MFLRVLLSLAYFATEVKSSNDMPTSPDIEDGINQGNGGKPKQGNIWRSTLSKLPARVPQLHRIIRAKLDTGYGKMDEEQDGNGPVATSGGSGSNEDIEKHEKDYEELLEEEKQILNKLKEKLAQSETQVSGTSSASGASGGGMEPKQGNTWLSKLSKLPALPKLPALRLLRRFDNDNNAILNVDQDVEMWKRMLKRAERADDKDALIKTAFLNNGRRTLDSDNNGFIKRLENPGFFDDEYVDDDNDSHHYRGGQ